MSKSTQSRRRSPDASIVTRRASINTTSFDSKTNMFSAVISAGTPVKRRDFDGSFYFEALAITPKSVRLGRVRDGVVPLLNSHRSFDLVDMLGVVTAVRMEDGQLIADIRLSKSDDAKAVAAAIAAGTPPNMSIGYQVHTMTESAARNGEVPTHTATDWELMEVSLVPIPADPKTHIRSQKGLNMDDDEILDDQNEHESEARVTPGGSRMSSRDVHEAYDIASRANLPVNFARQQIERGVTLDRFRAIVFDKLAGDADRTRSGNIRIESGDTFDNPEFLGRSIQDALYARMTGAQPSKAAASLMNESVLDFGKMLVRARGDRPAKTSTDLVDQMMDQRGFVGGIGGHGRDDFPLLLQGAGERVLRESYQAVETPLKLLARRRLVRDFRTVSSIRLSDSPRLMKVNEGGELKYGSRLEAKETGKIDTYGAVFALTRQALINDELDAFGSMARDWGRSAAETEAALLVAMLTANSGDGPELDDGNPVYGTARGNRAAAGTVIDTDNLGLARRALRDMTGLDGKTPINAASKYLLVGSAKETEGEKSLSLIAATKVDDSNPFSGKLTLLVEPRLIGNAWRVFADPAQIASITIAYLSGEVGPRLDIQQGWTVLGTEFRCTLDFGCWMEDWRGTYLNPGN